MLPRVQYTVFAAAVIVMRDLVQILAFLIIGIVLLWFGYTLLIEQWNRIRRSSDRWKKDPADSRGRSRNRQQRLEKESIAPSPGDPQVCPLCSSKLFKDELVHTLAFPSLTGGKDRLMHIQGCIYCISGRLKKTCPVCRKSLDENDILVARMFERKNRRNHVHVIGCTKCRRVGQLPH